MNSLVGICMGPAKTENQTLGVRLPFMKRVGTRSVPVEMHQFPGFFSIMQNLGGTTWLHYEKKI